MFGGFPPFFSLLQILKKILLFCPKSDLKWIWGEKRDASDVKTRTSYFSVAAIVKKAIKKIMIFLYLRTELP